MDSTWKEEMRAGESRRNFLPGPDERCAKGKNKRSHETKSGGQGMQWTMQRYTLPTPPIPLPVTT